ncbi:hydroxyphenylacetyl-CoA thioesterase PaaI [Maritalea porphyrae]|jgi:acyl-CoA thioesterase|uniref:hydroxyphenylacetyl-CoA thioesterase PaaI n=1 Tax=Maritalea porphyrae TaxID=880732 RepID=UPI0022B07C88|nr:hydroxyphenylacetyl-CoA thioesterase PaaI [Maritalea porphyrae]MCZ4271785.1 hydroxyphenylacetyl-CoA thioesterase PaaI [Maritalea porphyrae]
MITPLERAQKSAQIMWDNDSASQRIGMRLENVGVGTATLSMTINDQHLNGHKICHGGYVFMLADSAFAFACNSYNQLAVAYQNSITYAAPGMKDDVLTATAIEVSKTGRSGIYDVTITNQKGEALAHFRGHSRTIKGTHFTENEA